MLVLGLVCGFTEEVRVEEEVAGGAGRRRGFLFLVLRDSRRHCALECGLWKSLTVARKLEIRMGRVKRVQRNDEMVGLVNGPSLYSCRGYDGVFKGQQAVTVDAGLDSTL